MTTTSAYPSATRQDAPAAHAIDLRKTYGIGQAEVRALDGVTVTFERGRFTAVMGPSGSGWTSAASMTAG
jgi:putative ABC transport system ATP-binding protein